MGKCKCTFNSFILPITPTLQFWKTMQVLLWMFYISTVYYIKRSGGDSIYQLSFLENMTQNTDQKSLSRWESLNYFWASLCQYLIIRNGQSEGRELPLFIICNFHFGGCSFTIQCDVLILSLFFSWNIFLFLSLFPSSFISSIDVFCRLGTSENWTLRIFFEASTIHFVFTASN